MTFTSAKSCTPFRAVRVARPRFEGFQACLRFSPSDVSEIDILFLQRVIFNISFSDHMKKLKNLSLVGNTGYFDKEVNYAGSEALVGVKVVNIKLHVGPFVFSLFSLSLNFLHSVRPSPSVPRNTQITRHVCKVVVKALLLSASRVPIGFWRDFTGLWSVHGWTFLCCSESRGFCNCGASGIKGTQ